MQKLITGIGEVKIALVAIEIGEKTEQKLQEKIHFNSIHSKINF